MALAHDLPEEADHQELIWRDEHNPILTTDQLPRGRRAVFNPAAVQLDGETLLLPRIECRDGTSRLGIARSADGIGGWTIEEPEFLRPQAKRFPEELHGLEDPRITPLEELGLYAVTYVAYSASGPLVSLATTKDFRHFDKFGAVLPPENKDAALFPERIGGRWAMIHRPVSTFVDTRAHLWIGFSDDLHLWGDHRSLLPVRPSPPWDSTRIGLGPPPLLTDEGWLLLYHSVRHAKSELNYYLGVALLDRDDPTRILGRSHEWIFGPEAPYEQNGHGGVVFPCGWIRDGEELRIYYGAGDRVVALAHARVSELLNSMHEGW